MASKQWLNEQDLIILNDLLNRGADVVTLQRPFPNDVGEFDSHEDELWWIRLCALDEDRIVETGFEGVGVSFNEAAIDAIKDMEYGR